MPRPQHRRLVRGGVTVLFLHDEPHQPLELETHRVHQSTKEEGVTIFFRVAFSHILIFPQAGQPTVDLLLKGKAYNKGGALWEKRTRALASFVMKDCRPLSLIDGAGFRVWLWPPWL